MIPTIDDIRAAAERIKGIAVRTPLLRSDALDEATGAKVWVKAECLQRGHGPHTRNRRAQPLATRSSRNTPRRRRMAR